MGTHYEVTLLPVTFKTRLVGDRAQKPRSHVPLDIHTAQDKKANPKLGGHQT